MKGMGGGRKRKGGGRHVRKRWRRRRKLLNPNSMLSGETVHGRHAHEKKKKKKVHMCASGFLQLTGFLTFNNGSWWHEK